MSDIFCTIIVTAAEQVTAQDAAATVEGGAGMFTTACSPTGQPPATAYISSGYITEAIRDAVVLAVPDANVSALDPFTALAEAGLQLVTDPGPELPPEVAPDAEP